MASARMRGAQYARAYPYGTDGNAALNTEIPVQHAPTRHVVYSKERASVSRIPAVLVVGVLVFILGFTALFAYARVTSTAKKISALDKELAQITQLNEALEVRIAESDDPSRIRSVAINRLGMIHPSEGEIRYVNQPDTRASDIAAPDIPPQRTGFLNTLLRFLD